MGIVMCLAAYGTLSDGPCGAELRCTEYDLAAAAERIQATDYPQPETFEVLRPPSETQMLEMFEAAALR